MQAHIATLLCALGILALFALDRDQKTNTSQALWIPVLWLFIASSRMVSQWLAAMGLLNGRTVVTSADQLLDGSPLDRYLLTGLVVLGVIILARRGQRVGTLLRANGPIVVFVLYCGLSTLWSDFTDVSFKRWIKAVGDVVMILIVLTDPDPAAAIKRLLARLGILLVPLSLLLSKYYPALGQTFSEWGGSGYTGAATSKNELGQICLIFGVGSVWRLRDAFMSETSTRKLKTLIAYGVLLVMALWLFRMSSMMTALSCFLMASTLIVATGLRPVIKRPWIVHLLVAAIISISLFALFLDSSGDLVQALGRNPTLTGRTDLWNVVLGMNQNSFLGTGFESFWLGPRLQKIWSIYWWHVNEAHNGYIEVLLNLGWVGAGLLSVVILTGYRKVFGAFRQNPEFGGLLLAYFTLAVVYNFTESAIRIMHPIWILFLLSIMAASADLYPECLPDAVTDHTDDSSEWEPSVDHAASAWLYQGGA